MSNKETSNILSARDEILKMIGNVDHSRGGGENTARFYGEMLNSIREILTRIQTGDSA